MKAISDKQLISICFIISVFLCLIFIFSFFGYPSDKIEDWADTATYFWLIGSILSVLFIVLTYRSQIGSSSILEFESAFFQWYQIHVNLAKDLTEPINSFAEDYIIPFIENKSELDIKDFQNHENPDETRNIARYYRSLYSMMKYIHLSETLGNYDNKKKYYDIIQSRMTDNELLIVLYLLLSDKEFYNEEPLGGILYKELLDEAHLFKNIYYSERNKNFRTFALFMRTLFPKTTFRFMESSKIPECIDDVLPS